LLTAPPRDRSFLSALVRLALPIALQQLISTALTTIDVLMVAQLGDTAVAAAGLANQVFFLMSLFLFGVGSGSAVFAAQSWGRRDVTGLRRMLGLGLMLACSGSLLFSVAAIAAPSFVLSRYTPDPVVIAAGAPYLRVVGLSYLPTAITTIFAMTLRSTRNVRIPVVISAFSLGLKAILGYGLIFGKAGLPEMGLLGVAVATCISRAVECFAMVAVTYWAKLPAAARLSELINIDRNLLSAFARTSLPVVVGEIFWSLGVTAYMAIYARVGTEAVAAFSIASSIEQLALVPFVGLGNACAIVLGNSIGAGLIEHAAQNARICLRVTLGGALIMGFLMVISSTSILQLYQVSGGAQSDARGVLIVLACGMWVKTANMLIIVGIMRAGGDTRFALFNDVVPLWCIGVPSALIGAFVLHLPIYWVVALVYSDEIAKALIGIRRVLSGRWINSVGF
jgi:putative MATE family efflux protein